MDGSEAPNLLRVLHKQSSHHRADIERSDLCGCFYCLITFPPGEITDWCDRRDAHDPGQTALCPRCGIDSVLGSASGHPITPPLLAAMQRAWFGKRG